MNILLDYFFPITSITPTPQASTAWLKQACLVVKPKDETVEVGEVVLCTSIAQVEELAGANASAEAAELFAAGMNRIYVLPVEDLDLSDALEGYSATFFTVLLSSDFSKEEVLGSGASEATPAQAASAKIQDILYVAKTAGVGGNSITVSYIEDQADGDEAIVGVTESAIVVDIDAAATTAQTIADAIEASGAADALVSVLVDEGDETDIQSVTGDPVSLSGGADEIPGDEVEQGLDLGEWSGVLGVSSTDDSFLGAQAVIENRCGFHTTTSTKAKNMAYAFGKLLANALNWLNQQYVQVRYADDVDTLGEANNLFDSKISFAISDSEFGQRLALFACGGKAIVAPYIVRNLEIDIQSAALSYISGNQPNYTLKAATLLEDELKKVIDSYIERQWIEDGKIEIKLEQQNFVASGYINIAEPKALWRIFGEMRQTL
jgi:hypothetical protein